MQSYNEARDGGDLIGGARGDAQHLYTPRRSEERASARTHACTSHFGVPGWDRKPNEKIYKKVTLAFSHRY